MSSPGAHEETDTLPESFVEYTPEGSGEESSDMNASLESIDIDQLQNLLVRPAPCDPAQPGPERSCRARARLCAAAARALRPPR